MEWNGLFFIYINLLFGDSIDQTLRKHLVERNESQCKEEGEVSSAGAVRGPYRYHLGESVDWDESIEEMHFSLDRESYIYIYCYIYMGSFLQP